MRIVTPTGKVVNVCKVEPYVEVGFQINGVYSRETRPAKNMSFKPTALNISIDNHVNVLMTQTVYIGNLPAEKVQQIIEELCVSGYYDFSKMKYQQDIYNKTVIDNGVSRPYFIENMIINPADNPIGSPVFLNDFTADSEYNEDDEEDDEYAEK